MREGGERGSEVGIEVGIGTVFTMRKGFLLTCDLLVRAFFFFVDFLVFGLCWEGSPYFFYFEVFILDADAHADALLTWFGLPMPSLERSRMSFIHSLHPYPYEIFLF